LAHWTFRCKNCNKSFQFAEIEDTLDNYYFPAKPDMPAEGLRQKCPHCAAEHSYQSMDLVYEA
jgi:phage FluMu protein Com